MEVAKEEVLSMKESIFGNVRLAACTEPPKRPAHTASRAGPSFVQHFGSDQQGIGSCKRSVGVAEGEVLTMEKSVSGNARPPTCNGSPMMPAQTASYAGPSDVLRFASDQCGISSCRMFVEATEEEVQCMKRSSSRNVRPSASTRPPKRPTQTTSHVGVSMGTPGVAALVQNVIDPEATISESVSRNEEDTTGSLANIGEPTARRQRRMDWQKKPRFPSKQQW